MNLSGMVIKRTPVIVATMPMAKNFNANLFIQGGAKNIGLKLSERSPKLL